MNEDPKALPFPGKNELFPELKAPAEGMPAWFENRDAPEPKGGLLVGTGLTIEARNGFAAPPPVICGRRPWPRVELELNPPIPVGCEFIADIPPIPVGWELIELNELPKPKDVPELLFGCDSDDCNAEGLARGDAPGAAAGVVGAEPGIGGSESIRDAPNDDDGLKGFNPVKPVI